MSRRRKSQFVQRSEYALYRVVAAVARRLSDRGVQRWGARLGSLARRVLRSRDRLAMRNLRESFPSKSDKELREILNACWRHFGRSALHSIRMQNMSLDAIAARCRFVNAHLVEEAIARGNGVVLISAHYGAWEVGGLALMSLVKNVRTIARPLDNQFLERDVARLRARTGGDDAGAVGQCCRRPAARSGRASPRRCARSIPWTPRLDDADTGKNGFASGVRDCVRFLHTARNRASARVREPDPCRATECGGE
jgi:lauroyl/myristoyl acyltransferase